MTPWVASRLRRLDGPGRLAGIDLARGLAVVGMLAAHLFLIKPFDPVEPETWLDIVNGRSAVLFATLAGLSIALTTGGPRPLTGRARGRVSARLAVRAGLLWVIGVLLIITGVPVYVILPAYAILFVLSLPFLGLRAPALFAAAGTIALAMPLLQPLLNDLPFWETPAGEATAAAIGWHYPFPLWIAFLLAGMGAGRLDVRSARTSATVAAAGAVLAAVAYGLDALTGADAIAQYTTHWGAVWTARPHSAGLLHAVGAGGFALAVIGSCILLCRSRVLRWIALPLRATGAMPLTAYSAQLLVWAAVAAVLFGSSSDDAFWDLQPFWPMTAGILVACTAWALLIGRGPLEALVDRVARWITGDRDAAARRRGVDRLEG